MSNYYQNFKWHVWRQSWLYHKYLCWLKNRVAKLEWGTGWERIEKYDVQRSKMFGSWQIVQARELTNLKQKG